MIETWRSIVGFEAYDISDLGNVRSIDRRVKNKHGFRTCKGRVIKTFKSGKFGHVTVTLWNKSKGYWLYVHHLVLEAFVGLRPINFLACHNDGNPQNNCVINLHWATHSDNQLDRRKHGTSNRIKVKRSDGVVFDSMVEAAEASNCFDSNICKCLKGIYKTTGGFSWRYAGD